MADKFPNRVVPLKLHFPLSTLRPDIPDKGKARLAVLRPRLYKYTTEMHKYAIILQVNLSSLRGTCADTLSTGRDDGFFVAPGPNP
jgi:hypothetical protein